MFFSGCMGFLAAVPRVSTGKKRHNDRLAATLQTHRSRFPGPLPAPLRHFRTDTPASAI